MPGNTSLRLVVFGTLVVWSCLPCLSQGNGSSLGIIPTPSEEKPGEGRFEITHNTTISAVPEAAAAMRYLNQKLATSAGFTLRIDTQQVLSRITCLHGDSLKYPGREAYRLTVTSDNIAIEANDSPGFLYGVMSLLQMLPPEIVSGHRAALFSLEVPCVVVNDAPKYGWRSFMLDSGRQFQSKEFIKRYLEYLAMLKMNVFHWHLTEGQGWRIQIKKYPQLTEIGSKVARGEEQQGYYSREDIREIVDFAATLSIAVVPEIDVPGHSEAALIAYPELTCLGKKPESVMEYSPALFCAGKQETYSFLENVLDEVCEMFPGEYIHLGGDEAPKDMWDSCRTCQNMIRGEGLRNSHELQIYFSSRLSEYLQHKGKKVILWGDVVEQAGQRLPENVIIYWWNYRKKNDTAYQRALQSGYPVIGGTNYFTYLNYPVTPWSQYKEDRTFDLRMAYEGNPSNISDPPSLFLGMGSCLWTDWNVTMRMIDQRVFPRLLVLAEQMWNKRKNIPFEEFYERVKGYYPRMRVLGIRYGPALKDEVPTGYSWE